MIRSAGEDDAEKLAEAEWETAALQEGLLAAGIEKIELRVRATNARAIRLYEGLGFEREGVLRRRIRTQSGYIDDICMALMVGAGDWVG